MEMLCKLGQAHMIINMRDESAGLCNEENLREVGLNTRGDRG